MAAVYSLYLGRQFDRNVTTALARKKRGFRPRVCLVMPCKGLEPNLEKNIESALKQSYDNYRTAIITDSMDDPAYAVAKQVLSRHPAADSKLYATEVAAQASGKVNALLTVLDREKGQAQVYAFIDSDAQVPPRWLEDLVDPLGEEPVGATTGFRWYFSEGGFWSRVEAAWNASGTNLFFNDRYNFPWGGATAVRAEILNKIKIKKEWHKAISDDMSLNSALRKNGYRIIFVPQCTVATFNQTNRHDFLGWATRQVILTKTFNRAVWNYAVAAYSFLDLVLLLGVLGAIFGVIWDRAWFVPSVMLFSPYLLGIVRSVKRNSTFSKAMPEFAEEFRITRFPEAITSITVPMIMTYCILKSIHANEIRWRDRTYNICGEEPAAS